jgi:hypothetical protein
MGEAKPVVGIEASDRLAFWFVGDRTIRFIRGEAVGGSNDKNCVLACAWIMSARRVTRGPGP